MATRLYSPDDPCEVRGQKQHPLGIAFSEKISTESVMYLKTAINEHLSLFRNEYGARLIPKERYLVHLPRQVLKFGPLIRTWCMCTRGNVLFLKTLQATIR